MKLRLPAPVTKSVPQATKVPAPAQETSDCESAMSRGLRVAKALACHENAHADELRLPQHLRIKLRTGCACQEDRTSGCEHAAPAATSALQVRKREYAHCAFSKHAPRHSESGSNRLVLSKRALCRSESRPECAEGSFCALKMLTAPFSLTSSVWSSFNMYPAPGRARFDLHKFLRLPRNLHPSSKVLCPPWNSIQRLSGIGPVPQSAC